MWAGVPVPGWPPGTTPLVLIPPRGGRSAGEGVRRVPGTLGHQTGSQWGPSAAALSQSTLPELRNNGRAFSAFLNCMWLAAYKI